MDKNDTSTESDPFDRSDSASSNLKIDSDDSESEMNNGKDYSELQEYFRPGELEEISDYEKDMFLDQKKKFDYFQNKHNTGEIQLPVILPPFMKVHFERLKMNELKTASRNKRNSDAVGDGTDDSATPAKKKASSEPSRKSARVRTQVAEAEKKLAQQVVATSSQLVTSINEEPEEFLNLKHYFTPTEWSKMNYFAKRHAQTALDSYNKGKAEGLEPPLPKFMSRGAASTSVLPGSPASSLPVLDVTDSDFEDNTARPAGSSASFSSAFFDMSESDFENTGEQQVIRRRPQPIQRLPLRDVTNSSQNNVIQPTKNATSSVTNSSLNNLIKPTTKATSSVATQQLVSSNEEEDCHISEQIKKIVNKILPTIGDKVMQQLVVTLVDVNGVETTEDLALVELEWITTAGLKQIQAKKVLNAFCKQDNGKEGNTSATQEPPKKKKTVKKKDALMRDPLQEPVISSRPRLSNLILEVGMWDLSIDFGKFKDSLLLSLEKDEEPTASDRLHMVRTIKGDICSRYDELKQQNPSIQQKNPGKAICKKVVDIIFENSVTEKKFTPLFQDTLNGQMVGDGKFSLTDQLETCCENKYRTKRVQGERPGVPRKGTRQGACILPEKYCPPLTKSQKEEANEIRLDLITIYKTPQINWNWMHIKNQMNTYSCLAAQRSLITSKKRDISLIAEHWPFLTEVSGLVNHLDNITGSSLSDNFDKFVDSILDNLISYLTLMSPQRIVLNTILDDVVFGNGSLLHRRILGALVMLAIHWGEDQSRLIVCVEATTLPHEVLDVLPPNTPATPLIVALGTTPYLATEFYLVMNGVCLCSTLTNGLEAVMALCAAYFVFGILYPPDASTTLTFVERVIANLSDSSGLSKAQTPKGAVAVSSLRKCKNLEKSMEDFEKQRDRLRTVR